MKCERIEAHIDSVRASKVQRVFPRVGNSQHESRPTIDQSITELILLRDSLDQLHNP